MQEPILSLKMTNLASLSFIENYIKENKHFTEIASADEMKKDGINLFEMNIKLLQKVEKMTLYMIEQSKEIERLKIVTNSYKVLSERLLKIENKLKQQINYHE